MFKLEEPDSDHDDADSFGSDTEELNGESGQINTSTSGIMSLKTS
jgi:hypothetical protein